MANASAPSPTPVSVGTALLICDDASTIQQFTDSLKQLAVATAVCVEPSAALRILNNGKFEAVLVDFQLGEESRMILEQVRLSASNRRAVTFAITNSATETAVAFKIGSSFVIERPLTIDAISRTLKAAYGMIVRERRRYFRCPVAITAMLRTDDQQEIPCQTVNISEGGLAMKLGVPLQPGAHPRVSFTLPGRQNRFTTEARICWSKPNGLCGAQFLNLSPDQSTDLQEWLSSRLEESLPKAVAEKFRTPQA